MRGPTFALMLKQLQMGLRAFLVLASKIWTFVCFVVRKNTRAVNIHQQLSAFFHAFPPLNHDILPKVIQHQTVKYEVSPLSPLSKHRLSMCTPLVITWCVYIQLPPFLITDLLWIFIMPHSSGMVRRKILVLDLDETLIHSHHDGVIRQTVKVYIPLEYLAMQHDHFNMLLMFTAWHTSWFCVESHNWQTSCTLFCAQASSCWLFSWCGK